MSWSVVSDRNGEFGEWLSEHDTKLLDEVAEKLKVEMVETYPKNIYGVKVPTPFTHFSYNSMCNLLDNVIREIKGDVEK